jgi:radical SAM protein with 4Fe4S-binding SPASM domain
MNNLRFWIPRILKLLSFARLLNILKLSSSYYLSIILHRNLHWGMPSSISIEPTTSCNLHCPECPSGLRQFSRATGKLETQTLQRIIDELGKYLFYVTFYFQGEPLLHPQFLSFVKMLKHQNLLVGTSTNAHFLTEQKILEVLDSGLDRLIISLDGTDQETYATYRQGGNFDTVVENLQNLVRLKKLHHSASPFIELQFIVFKHNEHQVEEIKKLGKQMGVNKVSIKTAQLYEFENGNPLMPGLLKYSRYQEYEDGKFRIKSALPNRCYRSWSGNVITWDGNVVPCCFDKDASHQFGNLRNTSYKSIQQSADYRAFRQQILTDRSQIEICRNCTEGL